MRKGKKSSSRKIRNTGKRGFAASNKPKKGKSILRQGGRVL